MVLAVGFALTEPATRNPEAPTSPVAQHLEDTGVCQHDTSLNCKSLCHEHSKQENPPTQTRDGAHGSADGILPLRPLRCVECRGLGLGFKGLRV